MASRSDSTGSSRPRSRRSIAHVPRSKLTSAIDKENATTDIAAAQPTGPHTRPSAKDKKSRSKSLGPGGLDALQDSNGNRRKSTAAFPLKSILKPTVPVSPVRNIPSFEETRRRTPARGSQYADNQGNEQGKEGLLIDFDTPARPSASGSEDPSNPFDSFNASSIRDEMAAAREREEKERRERERKAILEQREARRKSMANRRVSFAPEATLHTWNVVEIPDDSTSSSASNSTRRASSLTTANKEPEDDVKQNEPPSSPYAESDIGFSPVQYPDLQQLQQRATSGNYNAMGSSQEMSSSPFSGSSVDGSEDTGLHGSAAAGDDDDNSSASDFDGESTAMSMDDMSVRSAATAQSDTSTNTSSSARLNEALRQAAREAGTRSIDDEEDGEMSMEIADQEITGAFQPWIKKGQRQSFDWEDISARHDQENVHPPQQTEDPVGSDPMSDDGDEDLSMEVTNAVGRILSKPASRRQSAVRRKSSGAESNYDEQTMEFTNVVGGIAQQGSPAKSTAGNEDEEMTMEFTSVVGGVLSKSSGNDAANGKTPAEAPVREIQEQGSDDDMQEGEDMEITGAVGGILPTVHEQTEPEDDGDQTAGMEVTAAIGRILPSEMDSHPKEQRMELETEQPAVQLDSSPFQASVQPSPAKTPEGFHIAAVASESGSPSLASVRTRRTRPSLRGASGTPTSTTPRMSPKKNSLIPPTQLTPQVARLTTSDKTPSSSSRKPRSASPRKHLQPERQESATDGKSPARRSLFGNSTTGESAPLFVLQPHKKRRSSGLGIDKEGLGSPKVAAMLDKRRSIGDEVPKFTPQQERQQGVRFEDPVKLQEEVDREREEEENREDGHIPPPLGERDATASLKDMISSLTPKKNKLRGRKSLHVGAARGVLGKRPIELDQDDEEDADSTPKRLKGREASPVKSIRLPAPPSKEETVGHLSPRKSDKVSTTPLGKPPSSAANDVMGDAPALSNASPESEAAEQAGPEFEPIQLQDFLNMTNIHFMELTTTKRRHTTAPDSATKRAARLSGENSKTSAANFDDCVAAGFCTVPMLELYQHSCRELKSYISEGRQIIRSIETETYADNPPLFKEYMTAPPDIRLLMDNQFRNVKTHARLLSKATWYEWRMKLLDGLKEGLNRHVEEMNADEALLAKHEALLNGAVPALVEKHASLEQEATNLQQLADEMENCDQDELRSAREKLVSVEEEIAAKKRQLQELQNEVQDKTDTIETGAELKAEFMAQIQEAERVKEECRGWSAKEINELKASVDKIERQTGWSIVSATANSTTGPLVTMSYRNQLQLSFSPRSFSVHSGKASTQQKTAIELRSRSDSASQLSPIALLVLKALQHHLAGIQQSTTTPRQLLRFVSEAWNTMLNLEEETRMLEFCGVTKLKLLEAEDQLSLRARCTLLEAVAAPKPTKKGQNTGFKRIDVDFAVKTRVTQNSTAGEIGTMDFETDVIASKVYGFGVSKGPSENEMQDLLRNELGGKKAVALGDGVWSKAVQMLTGTVF
ncbi:conserved hypothetical protein [Aspergillus terreus NIH2624]|uniref:Spc7 kinetochore protein domain-containing protein n=1 Tax=Aspergillus terreus (strain NIH 2624 / FGSC A1156) TaxID=341663 RepID=Q0CRL4_ASPTN|nr:uncharacterized protein ATEG_03670 [Aspergillus terreus NIH2624]EAU35472.1 conserved hypothetical protein [Aspergillus terreus NIH2624]